MKTNIRKKKTSKDKKKTCKKLKGFKEEKICNK